MPSAPSDRAASDWRERPLPCSLSSVVVLARDGDGTSGEDNRSAFLGFASLAESIRPRSTPCSHRGTHFDDAHRAVCEPRTGGPCARQREMEAGALTGFEGDGASTWVRL